MKKAPVNRGERGSDFSDPAPPYWPDPQDEAAELPLDADPPESRRECVRIDGALERVLQRLGVNASPWLERLVEAWPSLLPADLVQVTRPGKWEKQILYVYVANSMRLFELRRMRLAEIEQAVRRFAGAGRVRAVRLTIDPG